MTQHVEPAIRDGASITAQIEILQLRHAPQVLQTGIGYVLRTIQMESGHMIECITPRTVTQSSSDNGLRGSIRVFRPVDSVVRRLRAETEPIDVCRSRGWYRVHSDTVPFKMCPQGTKPARWSVWRLAMFFGLQRAAGTLPPS